MPIIFTVKQVIFGNSFENSEKCSPANQRKEKASDTPNSAVKVKPIELLDKETICEPNQEQLKSNKFYLFYLFIK